MRHVPASEQGWRGYESLYLPSPLLILRLRSGQAKEGNRKTLDPLLDWIPDQRMSGTSVEDDRGGEARIAEGDKRRG